MINEFDLKRINLPAATPTYAPVSHNQLIDTVRSTGLKIFGQPENSLSLVTNQSGSQLFGTMSFANVDGGPQIAVGFRNSYDKSMAVGLCSGLMVLVCSNMAFRGDITVFRKHTPNVVDDLESMTYETLVNAKANYSLLSDEIEIFKKENVDDQFGGALLGQMFVNNDILNTVQLNIAKEEWLKPKIEDFKPRNAWSLYNACTQALKKSSPFGTMEKYVNLHNFFLERI